MTTPVRTARSRVPAACFTTRLTRPSRGIRNSVATGSLSKSELFGDARRDIGAEVRTVKLDAPHRLVRLRASGGEVGADRDDVQHAAAGGHQISPWSIRTRC